MNDTTIEIPAPTLGRRLFRTIALIRAFEESVGKYFARGEIPGFVHLSIGEEAVAAGVCATLDERDKITSTHRGHGHCLARGSDVDRMMAELYGRETGLCRGRGGTMHIYDLETGVLGTNGIVAAGGGLACGAALAAKLSGSGGVAVCFMGDGATDEGATHEAMNLAALWALPVLFVVENNGFSQATPLHEHTSARTIVDRAAAYSMPGVRVDGQNAMAVYEVAREAVERARDGGGPILIEALTSRFRGHYEGDAMQYTRDDPDAEQATRDPLEVLRAILETEEMTPAAELDEDVASATRRVAEARRFALDQPRPRPETLLEYVFASQHGSNQP
jgi:TPP-dependent pyruvate/acetoin dehydrogenase alpha subunit